MQVRDSMIFPSNYDDEHKKYLRKILYFFSLIIRLLYIPIVCIN